MTTIGVHSLGSYMSRGVSPPLSSCSATARFSREKRALSLHLDELDHRSPLHGCLFPVRSIRVRGPLVKERSGFACPSRRCLSSSKPASFSRRMPRIALSPLPVLDCMSFACLDAACPAFCPRSAAGAGQMAPGGRPHLSLLLHLLRTIINEHSQQ